MQQNFSNRTCLNDFLNLEQSDQVEKYLSNLIGFQNSNKAKSALEQLDPSLLVKFAHQLPLSETTPYVRKILWKSNAFEVMLARWNKQVACAPHNHGFSQGLVWFVQGTFEETTYHFQEEQLIQEKSSREWQTGDVSLVHTPAIHSCRPHNGGVTLHIYSPPIHNMKVYSREEKVTYTVTDTCGAWIPQGSSDFVSKAKWSA